MLKTIFQSQKNSIKFARTQIVRIAAGLTFSLLWPITSQASTLFEGYYKVFLGENHIGYFVQRYESLTAKKQMRAVYFININVNGESTTEGLTAVSDEHFNPVSYQYTALAKGQAKAIDATFAGGKMTAKLTEGGQVKSFKADIPPNGFLSVFLNYVILKNGLAVGKSYAFEALAEEEGKFHRGSATVSSEKKIVGADAFSLDFKYKGTEFTSLMTVKGEPLGTLQQSVRTELVRTRAEAVGGHKFPEKTIQTLFGKIPEGTMNPLHAKPTAAPAPAATMTTTPTLTPPPVPTSMPPKDKSGSATKSQ